MSDGRAKQSGRILRMVASRGWAEEDADVLRDLLVEASALAEFIVSGQGASAEAEAAARDFLAHVAADTFDAT